MSKTVIRAENISKQYRLGLVGSGTLKDDLARFWAQLRGKEDPTLKIGQTNDRTQAAESDYVWALKDINFEVKQGEVLGIIGKNGAGKSTLLKILSKITAPTTGSIKVRGRIASLLEVGTGFHGELTGRENIYLNGAVLGMQRQEVTRKLDEIIAFAGIEKYVDTPVKRYSSGMTVRLGFAVAAHLEPDILVVDEVLAVGDVEFQKKAIGKMQDVSTQEGRTILFVSHNMASVKALCTSGLIMKNGEVSYIGENINDVVDNYLHENIDILQQKKLHETTDRSGNGDIKVLDFGLCNATKDSIELGQRLSFFLDYEVKYTSAKFYFFISLNNENNICVNFLDSRTIKNFSKILFTKGQISINLTPDYALSVGKYFVNIAVFSNGHIADYIQQAYVFNVVDGPFFDTGKQPAGKGICLVQQEWKLINKDETN